MDIISLSVADNRGIIELVYTQDGERFRSIIIPGFDVSDYPQEVQDFCAGVWTQQVVDDFQASQNAFGPLELSLDSIHANAIRRIESAHSRILFECTGKASTEERDTWSLKAEAAPAYLAATATAAQAEMIETEAAGDGVDPAELAQKIVDKAALFRQIVGIAGGLKAQAKAAVKLAIEGPGTIDEISASVDQILDDIKAQAETAISAWQSGGAE